MVSNTAVAAKAREIATSGYIPYDTCKCDAFIERAINEAGMQPPVNWAGTNDMVRDSGSEDHHLLMDIIRPLRGDYLAELKPGDLLLIKADNESGLPAQYRGDGRGDFEHVGIFLGDEFAFEDVDKNGNRRMCNVAHSSATMGRVAGSRLEKKLVSGGWGYMAQAACISYGGGSAPEMSEADYLQAPGYIPGVADTPAAPPMQIKPAEPKYATVQSPNGKAVKARKEPSKLCDNYREVVVGTKVKVVKVENSEWSEVRLPNSIEKWYMMNDFLWMG